MDQNKNKKFNLTLNEKEEIANLSNPKEKLIKLFKNSYTGVFFWRRRWVSLLLLCQKTAQLMNYRVFLIGHYKYIHLMKFKVF